MSAVRLTTYDRRYAADFARLNYQWIETFFVIETEDRLALEDPEGYAIRTGGEIFFVLEGERVVGTAAMVPFKAAPGAGTYELAKMAVQPDCQGRGYSKLLMQACIDFARAKHASEIVLITNDQLAPALGLYTAAGFVPMPQNSDGRYARGNLEMRLYLNTAAPT
jgi:GNAT superfamily N-acetyltransferase